MFVNTGGWELMKNKKEGEEKEEEDQRSIYIYLQRHGMTDSISASFTATFPTVVNIMCDT